METDHAAACRFFTPGDACRVALAAYRAAAERLTPPFGGPWFVEGLPFAAPADFADDFVAELVAQVGLLALDRLGQFVPPEERGDPWARAYLAEPEKMRQIISERETALRKDREDFGLAESHELRDIENAGHNAATEGESTHAGR